MDELVSQGFADVEASFKPDRVRVAVNAPFGEGRRATEILDRYGPIALDDKGAADLQAKSALTARDLDFAKIAHSATPLSNFFGWSVLKDYRSPFWPKALVDDPTPLSNRFGWSVLYGAFSGGAARPPEGVAAAEKAFPAPGRADISNAEAVELSHTSAAAPDEAELAQAVEPTERKRRAPLPTGPRQVVRPTATRGRRPSRAEEGSGAEDVSGRNACGWRLWGIMSGSAGILAASAGRLNGFTVRKGERCDEKGFGIGLVHGRPAAIANRDGGTNAVQRRSAAPCRRRNRLQRSRTMAGPADAGGRPIGSSACGPWLSRLRRGLALTR